jgi:integration host factor subunit beta
MATTTKKDLIDWIADETDQKRTTVKRTVQCFLDKVIDELRRGNRLEFRDFGVFEIRDRAPRVAQNPKTLERVPVPAKRTVKFKVGRLMKVALEQNARVEVARRKDGVVTRTARVPVASYAQDS